jgi:hypothetical protein
LQTRRISRNASAGLRAKRRSASRERVAEASWKTATVQHLNHATLIYEDGFAVGSPLEESGFEPSVPRKAPGVVVVSVPVRAEFSVDGEYQAG